MVGTRTFRDWAAVRSAYDWLQSTYPDAVVHTGDADGADLIAERVGSERGVPVIVHRAAWRRPDGSLDRAAGHKRNPDIVNPCSILLAFYGPGVSNGTDGSVKIAHRNGIPVYVFRHGTWTPPLGSRAE